MKSKERTEPTALEILNGISLELKETGKTTCNFESGFGSGLSGLALFWAYFSKVEELPKSAQRHAVDEALRLSLADQTFKKWADVGLFSGWTGAAWARWDMVKVLGGKKNDFPGAFFSDLAFHNAYLLNVVRTMDFKSNYDLISGWVGWGLYALKGWSVTGLRIYKDIAEEVFRICVNSASVARSKGNAYKTWMTQTSTPLQIKHGMPKTRYYNMGLAHGIPAIAVFLSSCVAHGIGGKKSAEMLDVSVQWLLSEKRDGCGFSFPPWIKRGEKSLPGRLAWCYGDPGVSSAILLASETLGRPAWRKEAARIFSKALDLPRPQAGVVDASFCHGASGVMYLCHKFNLACGQPQFKKETQHWERQLLQMASPSGTNSPLYPPKIRIANQNKKRDHASLLLGSSGIGLALYSAKFKPKNSSWDQLLGLSVSGS